MTIFPIPTWKLSIRMLTMLLLLSPLSCKDEVRVVELFEKGVLDATSSNTSIKAGESVTFEDNSSKVLGLLWTFDGGTPGSSAAPNVTVTYEDGGIYEAKLVVTFVDNTTAEKVFTIDVEGLPIEQGPYTGAALTLPGTLEVENYDLGGSGKAYQDSEEENLAVTAGSAEYRSDDGIDLQVSDDGSLVNIGYTAADEWVEYTVNVAEAADYDFAFIVASDPGGAAIKIQHEDAGILTDLGEMPAFGSTGGWGIYDTVLVTGISLDAGEQVLRLAFTGGNTNVDRVIISAPGVSIPERYGIYTEGPVTAGSGAVGLEINNAFIITEVTNDVFEGANAVEFKFDPQDTWGVMGAIRLSDGAGGFVDADISEFASGFYNISLKTTCTLKMNLRLQGGGTNGFVQLDDAVKTYGFERDGAWHTLKIPISDFVADGGATPNYSAISHFLVMRSAEPAVAATEDWDWYVDNVYLSKE